MTSSAQVQTHRIDLPSSVNDGVVVFITFIGPPQGSYVVGHRAHFEFTTGGAFTADDLLLAVNPDTGPNFIEWEIYGDADLGWPAAGGTYIGDLATTDLNGLVPFTGFPWSVWDVSFGPAPGSGQNGLSGQFVNSYIEVDYLLAGAGPGVPFCFGQGCPCGNDDFSAGCSNSTGSGALLGSSGTPSVALDDLGLAMTNAPPLRPGLFFMGQGSTSLPFGDGLRCAASGALGLRRFPVDQIDATGTLSLGAMVSLAGANHPGSLVPGETWNFQGWFRDQQGPCGSGSNVSNALQLTIIP